MPFPSRLNLLLIVQLPNNKMDDWFIENGQTSYWWKSYCGSDTNTPWGSMNLVSTSEGGSNDSNFSSSRNGMGYCAASGTDRTTDARSGNAALIKTVGWGQGNSAAGGSSSIKHASVGQLHLGSSPTQFVNTSGESYDGVIDFGYPFSSRPSSLSFWYKYQPKNSNDYGYAEIWLKSADGKIIAKETRNLTRADQYTEVVMNLPYTVKQKAAKICVIFRSSANPDCYAINESNLTYPGFAASKDTQTVGSQLYIDDVTLNYD